MPPIKTMTQAFCVPITFSQPLYLHETTSGPSDEPLKIKPGSYDLVVALARKQDTSAEDASWRAKLVFLPPGTVGPCVLKLSRGRKPPKEVYLRGGDQ
jgi:hypothetical protein